MRLRTHLFLWLSVLFTAATVALTGIESRRLGQVLADGEREAHRLAAIMLMERVDQTVEAQIRVQKAIALMIETRLHDQSNASAENSLPFVGIRDLSSGDLARRVAEYRRATDLKMVVLADADANSVFLDPPVGADGQDYPPTNYSDREYYRALVATGDTTVSKVEIGKLYHTATIYTASPIFGQGHRLAGYLASSIDLATLRAMTDRAAKRLPGSEVVLLDGRGQVIAASGASRFEPMQDLSGVALFHPVAGETAVREGADPLGASVNAAIAGSQSQGLGWSAVIYRPNALLANQISRARLLALVVALLLLLPVLALSYLFASLLAAPLGNLVRVATAVGEGDFEGTALPPVRAWAPVEIRGLLGAIEEMRQKLKASRIKELSESNALLTESLRALGETQERLLQADRLAAVGQLAGGVAHDFNNLLTIILSAAAFIEEDPSAGEDARSDATEITKAAKRGAKLTRQLLAFSRRQVLVPQVLDLNAVVAEAEPMLARLIGQEIQLTVTLSTDPASVLIDPVQVEQVMLNLVANARDALPKGGNIQVEVARGGPEQALAFGRRSTVVADWVVLSVSDDGVGMTEEVRARVFEPFFTTKGPDKGTGLGLATVYGIVKQSGGEILIQSLPGSGTVVRVLLPLSTEILSTRSEPIADGATPSPLDALVFLVEDEIAIRLLTARILRQAGYRVIDAGSPLEALELAAVLKERVALLLTDVLMPELSGPKLAEQFVALHPEADVLFMSGFTAVAGEAVADPTRFMQKPFTPEELVAKIRGILKRPRFKQKRGA